MVPASPEFLPNCIWALDSPLAAGPAEQARNPVGTVHKLGFNDRLIAMVSGIRYDCVTHHSKHPCRPLKDARSNTGKNPTRAPRVVEAGKWLRTHGLQPAGSSASGTLRTAAANGARLVVRAVLGRAGTRKSPRATAYVCFGPLTTSHRPSASVGDN